MANFTRKAIKSTFLKLLNERPLNEITIKSIVEECGINRNTFYYHFQDLPTLLQEIMKEECDAAIQKYAPLKSGADCFAAITDFIFENRRAVIHIYNSVSRDMFEYNLMRTSQYFVENYINAALTAENITIENKELLVNYYKCLCFGIIIDWLEIGLKEEYMKGFQEIFKLKSDMEVDFLQKLKEHI